MAEWRAIPGYSNRYEVSDEGQIRSVDHTVTIAARGKVREHTRLHRGRVLKQFLNGDGYFQVSVSEGLILTHRAVAQAFHGPSGGLLACHNNGISTDNRSSNLRWGTPSSNIRDSVDQGTHAKTRITHCPQGHAYDGANTYIKPSTGHRQCRACERDRKRALRAA